MSFERWLCSVIICGCLAPSPPLTSAQTAPVTSPAPQTTMGATAPASAPAITNADIIKLAKAGMSDTTIVQLIQKGPDNFDTSPNALIALKQAGVSETVISAMLTAPTAAPAMASAPAMPMPSSPAAAMNTMNAAPMGAASTTPSMGGMPASAPSMTATPAATAMNQMPAATTTPAATPSMGGMPGAPAAPLAGAMGATPPSSSTAPATLTSMGMPASTTAPATSTMGGMNAGSTAMPAASGMAASGPAVTNMGGAATNMGTQALQNYGTAMPKGTATLAQTGLQQLTGHFSSPSVQASGVPVATLSPLQIQAALYLGTQSPNQMHGLIVWDTASGPNPWVQSLETVAAQEAKLPTNIAMPNMQHAPSGFGTRILTPTEWLVQLASDYAAQGKPLQPAAVTPDMLRQVLHVMGYYSAPGTLGGVNNVYLTDAAHKKTLQPSTKAPFFAQGVIGMVAEFPLDQLAQLRQQDPEFEVVVVNANGKSKSFKIKKAQFAQLP